MKVTTLGIDLAKNVFQLHGVNEFGKPVIKKQICRDQMTEFFMNLQACFIGAAKLLARYRVRQGFVKAHTAQANQIRGLLSEFGLIIPQVIGHIANRVPERIK